MRPFTSTISLEEARRRLAAAVRPIARTERVPLADAAGRVAAADVTLAHRRAAVRAIGDGRLRGRRGRHRGRDPRRARSGFGIAERIYTGQLPRAPIAPGTLRGNRDRRAAARRADAVVMVEETAPRRTTNASRSSRAATAGQNIGRRGADISPGDLVVAARRSAEAEPRSARSRPSAAPTSRCSRGRAWRALDRQRGRRAGHAAGARPDLRRQPLHARRRRRGARRRRPSRTQPVAGHDRRADDGARRAAPAPI